MNVLIVEDDTSLASVIKEIFDPIVDECKVVNLFSYAMTEMTNRPFDIVTLDVNLPDVQGRGTLKRIKDLRAIRPDSIIVIYTGITTPELEKEAMDFGADGFISKQETSVSKGGFIGAFRGVLKNIISQPMRYGQSINLLEKLVTKIAQKYQLPST